MSRHHKPREEVYAVIRFDPGDAEPQNSFTVKEIVRSPEIAAAEVDRLTALNAAKGCVYFWQMTRLFGPGEAAGGAGE